MLRRKDSARRQEADRQEEVCLDQIQMDDSLLKINESNKRYKEEEMEDSRINLIQDTANKELLQMKWLGFLALKMDTFADGQAPAPARTVAPRSRSLSRKPQRPCNPQRTWTRVQSVDREKMDEDPTFSFLRRPRAVEPVLKRPGSPLEERCANVQTPTSKGAFTMQPQKMMNQVKRVVLTNLNQNTQA